MMALCDPDHEPIEDIADKLGVRGARYAARPFS